ncbi:DUF982 domain-containing protein [Tianweitania sediminis]|uniref:DUF982 domain-containing protein n=1 Tax=Tianweitania sediminis TaxID=1502156 RepID=A0A8J7R9J8_9HYPH|nr:DUF982 domain-containing protein [Tianweitania sediminis]MBP0441355.1 DUF982 domain-containing protein [Tianweitania sediminis]
MHDLRFEQPVSIFVGLGFPSSIESVEDAYRILNDWDGRRGPAHSAALNACRAAIHGEIEPETVRGIFTAFAKAHGIIVPDAVGAETLGSSNRLSS